MVPFERALVSSYRPSIVTFYRAMRLHVVRLSVSLFVTFVDRDSGAHRLEILETNCNDN